MKHLKPVNFSHLDEIIYFYSDVLNATSYIETINSNLSNDNYYHFGAFDGELIFALCELIKTEELTINIELNENKCSETLFKEMVLELLQFSLKIDFNKIVIVIEDCENYYSILKECGFSFVNATTFEYNAKTLVFNGSPKKGTCSSICDDLKARLINVEVINCYDYNIKACIDCNYCIKNPCKCIFDDMNEIYTKISEANNIIFVSPVHVGSVSAPMLDIFSRLQTYFHNKFTLKNNFPFSRKHGFAVAVSGSDWQGQKESMETIYTHAFNEMNCSKDSYLYLTNSDNNSNYSYKLNQFYQEVSRYVREKE